jgi:hypothetical protein
VGLHEDLLFRARSRSAAWSISDIPLGSNHSVYNVAGASVLVEWTASYGSAGAMPERVVGPVRWTTTDASFIFEEPPEQISTSYVERHNLTMRMQIRRFTRLTNGFSKKVRNHAAAVALDTFFYNFGRPHRSLANPYPRTPAMAAGVADHIWTCEEIAALLD